MKFTFFLLLINFSFPVVAQEITITSGSYENLKNISEYNLVFDYSNLNVTDFESEEAYLQKTMLEKEQQSPGMLEFFVKNGLEIGHTDMNPDI